MIRIQNKAYAVALSIVLVLAAASLAPALAMSFGSSCTWGSPSGVTLPTSTALRAYGNVLHAPGRIATDQAGRLYITDPDTGQIIVRDRYGRLQAVMEGFESPLGIAVDKAGRIYVGERGPGSVTVFDTRWTRLAELGQGAGEVGLPNDIAIDPDPAYGWIFVADSTNNRILVYNSDGTRRPDAGAFGSNGIAGTGTGQFGFPAAVYVTLAGEVYVADQNNDRVQVFTRDGVFLRRFGRTSTASDFTTSTCFGRLMGLAGDAAGRLYIADAFQSEVAIFDPAGVRLGAIGTPGDGPGQLRTPVGLAVDPYNRLLVASVNNARVELFGLDTYSDPQILPAVVYLKPDTLKRPDPTKSTSTKDKLTAYLTLSGIALTRVDPASLTANGVAATPGSVAIGDFNGDGTPELRVAFPAAAVLATVPDGQAIIVVDGALTDGTAFEGSATVRVQPAGGK